jgi:hypothetical protein
MVQRPAANDERERIAFCAMRHRDCLAFLAGGKAKQG